MRRIAIINQKGGVGKTTTAVNLGAALARAGRRVVLVDLDPQANLSMHLGVQLRAEEPSIYSVLLGDGAFVDALRDTPTSGLRLVPSSIDLSGAELELANAFGRELLLREALDGWERGHRELHGRAPADYVLLDCPPSLGLLSVNGLVAAGEAFLTLQTEFFALQGTSRLVEVLQLLRRRLNPRLELTGILPCLYDSRLKLAREVLAEIRAYFPGQVFRRPIAKNVKLAEAPSYGRTIFEYAPDSPGAQDYRLVALEVLAQELRDPDLAGLERPAPPAEPEEVADDAPEALAAATPAGDAPGETAAGAGAPARGQPAQAAAPPAAPASEAVSAPQAEQEERRVDLPRPARPAPGNARRAGGPAAPRVARGPSAALAASSSTPDDHVLGPRQTLNGAPRDLPPPPDDPLGMRPR